MGLIDTGRRRRALALVLCTLLLLQPLPVLAAPSTRAIREKRAEADAARAKMDDMGDRFSMLVEEYDSITDSLDKTRAAIAQKEDELEAASQRLDDTQGHLGDRAEAIYKRGSVSPLELLIGTTSFDDLVTRVTLFARIAENDARLVGEVKDARRDVQTAKASLESREAEQEALRRQAEGKKRELEAQLAKQRAYVRSLDSEVAKLVEEEERRQAAIAEELARKAREEAARRAAGNGGGGDAGGGAGGGTRGDVTPGATLIDTALKLLGVPYLWGGTSPETGFDCSGFTQYVYRLHGIQIPRTSRQQFAAGTHIPPGDLSALRPGDLVFFGYGGDPNQVHHVGMYIGGGNMIHAAGSGSYVKISSLVDRIERKHDYVGASRF